MAGSRKKRPPASEIDELEAKRRELESKIAELEALPKQLELEILEQERTMPPPEDIEERRRQREFEERAARGQIRNERRTQGRSLLLTLLLVIACASMLSWVISLLRQ